MIVYLIISGRDAIPAGSATSCWWRECPPWMLRSSTTTLSLLRSRCWTTFSSTRSPEERDRLNISVRPVTWSPRVVRARVPWHQNYLQARQFCRHNLFSLNTVMNKLNDLWWRRYNNLRFVVPNRLRGVDGGPVSPQELEDRWKNVKYFSIVINDQIFS